MKTTALLWEPRLALVRFLFPAPVGMLSQVNPLQSMGLRSCQPLLPRGPATKARLLNQLCERKLNGLLHHMAMSDPPLQGSSYLA